MNNSNPRYIYTLGGKQNIDSLPATIRSFLKVLIKDGKKFLMSTKDYKTVFVLSCDNQVLEFNSRKGFLLVQRHGNLILDCPDLLIISNKRLPDLLKTSTLKSFKNIDDRKSYDSKLEKPEKTKLTKEMLDKPFIFGEYEAKDQGHGNLKGTVYFYLNLKKTLYKEADVGRDKFNYVFGLN